MYKDNHFIGSLQRDVVILLGIACLFVYRFFKDSILIFKFIPDYIFYPSVALFLIMYASWRYPNMMRRAYREHIQNVPSIIGYLVLAAIGLMVFVVHRQKIDIYAFVTAFLYIFLAIYFVATKILSDRNGKK